jgi:hypothetical protein
MTDIILTSCGRWDLLARTLKSFLQHYDLPYDRFIVNDDSGHAIPDAFRQEFPMITFFDGTHRGQVGSIDFLYSQVQNEYIMFLEDDWEFFRTGFGKASLQVLAENPQVIQVWLRSPNDRNGHPATGPIRKTQGNVMWQFLSSTYAGGRWPGFSHNPGLKRLSDYQRLFPNGYGPVTTWKPKEPWLAESQIGKIYARARMKAATLTAGYVRHIGQNRHISHV